MDEFLLRALIAGLGLVVVAAPFGCLVVWRRLAYFGDTLAHGSLLGVVLALALDLPPMTGIIAVSVAVAVLLSLIARQRRMSGDTVLGILSHGALATGLVCLSLLPGGGVNLMAWLLGDILAVTWTDVAVIWGGGAVVLAGLAAVWRPLLAATVDVDLARVEGHAVDRSRLVLMVLVALVVAAAMKIVGVLLVTALLIVPAAAARRLARTPEQMVVLAALAGACAVIGGLAASWRFDTPTGPSVVVVAAILFAAVQTLPNRA